MKSSISKRKKRSRKSRKQKSIRSLRRRRSVRGGNDLVKQKFIEEVRNLFIADRNISYEYLNTFTYNYCLRNELTDRLVEFLKLADKIYDEEISITEPN